MTSSVWFLVLAVFLSGAIAGVFLMLVIGIRTADRGPHLADGPATPLDAITRTALGVGVRTSYPARDNDAEVDDQ
jgi:hypothetical protein